MILLQQSRRREGGHRARLSRDNLRKRLFLSLGVAAAIVVALTSCSIFGDGALGQQDTATNLANQREAALKFISGWPETERIRFLQEGVTDPGGDWAAYSVITIHGKDYHEHLGPHELGGDPLPSPDPSPASSQVTVIFSDGSSEVLG
jgi:hypothetical protein